MNSSETTLLALSKQGNPSAENKLISQFEYRLRRHIAYNDGVEKHIRNIPEIMYIWIVDVLGRYSIVSILLNCFLSAKEYMYTEMTKQEYIQLINAFRSMNN